MRFRNCDFCKGCISVEGFAKRTLVYRLCDFCYSWSLPNKFKSQATHHAACKRPSPPPPKVVAKPSKPTKPVPVARPKAKRVATSDGSEEGKKPVKRVKRGSPDLAADPAATPVKRVRKAKVSPENGDEKETKPKRSRVARPRAET